MAAPLVTYAEHGGVRFVAAVENGALSATQFHPEKSGDAGAALLASWVRSLRGPEPRREQGAGPPPGGPRGGRRRRPGAGRATPARRGGPQPRPRRSRPGPARGAGRARPARSRPGSAGPRARRWAPVLAAARRSPTPWSGSSPTAGRCGRRRSGVTVLAAPVVWVLVTDSAGPRGPGAPATVDARDHARRRRPPVRRHRRHPGRRAPRSPPPDAAPGRLELLPAVDVADGQAVRLVQGEAGSETAYGDPMDAAMAWVRDGAEWIHLVDLDAAFGRGSNAEELARVVRAVDDAGVKVELSGGIRDDASPRPRAGHRLPAGQPRHRRAGGPRLDPPRHRRARRPDRRRASTSAAPRSPRAAGRRRAATCGRPSPASTPTAAPATSSPTSPRTAPCAGPNVDLLAQVCAATDRPGRRLGRHQQPRRPRGAAGPGRPRRRGRHRRQGAVRRARSPCPRRSPSPADARPRSVTTARRDGLADATARCDGRVPTQRAVVRGWSTGRAPGHLVPEWIGTDRTTRSGTVGPVPEDGHGARQPLPHAPRPAATADDPPRRAGSPPTAASSPSAACRRSTSSACSPGCPTSAAAWPSRSTSSRGSAAATSRPAWSPPR